MSEWLKNAEGIATVVIAIYVASVGTLQWKIAQEKLRLDLYDRRFKVYDDAANYIHFVLYSSNRIGDHWNQDQTAVQTRFYKSLRSSKFLFDQESGITAILDQLRRRSLDVVYFPEDEIKFMTANPMVHAKRAEARDESLAWILGCQDELDMRMKPFLYFDQVKANPSIADVFDPDGRR